MRWHWVVLFGLMAFLSGGCAGGSNGANASFSPPSSTVPTPTKVGPSNPSRLIVEPASGHRGRIILVNASARYVVVSCPFGYIPALERRLSVYRGSLKVAEIKITGPQRDTNTIGDIVVGECQVGDEAREE